MTFPKKSAPMESKPPTTSQPPTPYDPSPSGATTSVPDPREPPPPTSTPTTANPMNAPSVPDPAGTEKSPTGSGIAVDVDPIVEVVEGDVPAWHDPDKMADEIERHAAKSHGLTPDVELLRKIVRFIRVNWGKPASDEGEGASETKTESVPTPASGDSGR